MTYEDILKLVTQFYGLATTDFLIGYHFRVIEDFDTHIPRIASFWENQVMNHVTHPEHFPFRMMAKHFPLKLKRGELDRWVLLFFGVLDEHAKNHPSHQMYIQIWKARIEMIRENFKAHPAMLHQG
jgi:truncated hemoglobin YjbI